jgi:hypothetical protein
MLIAALLFAQMMVAAYACPVMAPHDGGNSLRPNAESHAESKSGFEATQQPAAIREGCDGMSFDTSNLCSAHCQAGDQTTDGAQTPVAPICMLSSLYVVPAPSAPADARSAAAVLAINAIPPPHTILHCCFRI